MSNKRFVVGAGIVLIAAAIVFYGCQDDAESDETYEAQTTDVSPADPRDTESMESETDGTEHEVEMEADNEEEGSMYTRYATAEFVQHGIQLVIEYNEEAKAFSGTIQNTTNATISDIRVEVHLSNGIEVGPTPDTSLDPDALRELKLEVEDIDFVEWNVHVEVGTGEHDK